MAAMPPTTTAINAARTQVGGPTLVAASREDIAATVAPRRDDSWAWTGCDRVGGGHESRPSSRSQTGDLLGSFESHTQSIEGFCACVGVAW